MGQGLIVIVDNNIICKYRFKGSVELELVYFDSTSINDFADISMPLPMINTGNYTYNTYFRTTLCRLCLMLKS